MWDIGQVDAGQCFCQLGGFADFSNFFRPHYLLIPNNTAINYFILRYTFWNHCRRELSSLSLYLLCTNDDDEQSGCMLLLTKFVHYIGLKTRLSFGLWPRICLFNVELRFFSVNVLFDCSAAVFFLSSLWLIQHWSGYVDDSSHFLHHYNITNFCGPVDESPCYLWDSLVLIPTHWADTAIQQTTLRKKTSSSQLQAHEI